MKAKIAIVTLGVGDLRASLAFYRDGLGLPARNDKEDEAIVFFALEGTWLALYPRDKLAEDAMLSPVGSGFSGVTLAHNAGSKAQVDAVFAHALEKVPHPD